MDASPIWLILTSLGVIFILLPLGLILGIVLRALLSSANRIRHCRGCGDPLPERGVGGRCWTCGLPYEDSSHYMDEFKREQSFQPTKPPPNGEFRKRVDDIQGER